MEGKKKSKESSASGQQRVGLLYDSRMCKHYSPNEPKHVENPNRIRSIWNRLEAAGVPQRCVLLEAKKAEDRHVRLVHSRHHVNLIKNISAKGFKSRRSQLASELNSVYFNEGSSEAAFLAAGSAVEVVEKVASGELDSAVAIVRPPGHHAEHNEAMGFCLFNNVAVAARYLLDERPDLGVKKILIVDWDVHHGNGTQKTFWNDSRVLFFSVHRHDFGAFYPAEHHGFYTQVGEGEGAGYNINVPWEQGKCGDPDYIAVWDHILLPVAKEFNPDIVIVSAGFDAAVGDPLGGCRVTAVGYSVLLEKLMNFAKGRIVLILEGGYYLDSIAKSMHACLEVLLTGKSVAESSKDYPFESTWNVIQAVREMLSPFWPTLAPKLPQELVSQIGPSPHTLISSSDSEDEDDKGAPSSGNLGELIEDVLKPLSKLKVDADEEIHVSSTWRSALSNVYIWYASYGSNMWKARFNCYLEGGQVDGMVKQCSGSVNRTLPKEITWKTFPCDIFFGRDSSHSWGLGGVAFLNPEKKFEGKTYTCLYKISLEQFNDILFQENILSLDAGSPLVDITTLNAISDKEFNSLEVVKGAWYGNVVYLGKEQDIPVITMTSSLLDMERFKSGKLPLRAPNKAYANSLIKGLVEGEQLSEAEAIAYIEGAAKSL
ncbi:hypothetical protein LR48_Vigan01g273700 [Vigna angularis]|uniref:histone deacetylase n=2 Tax=Phaseolus angularis TaxID=3914 RepID=A0A0L9TRR5_PHAAN|nr:histone deacetylase 5 [Vigna angularis]KAG2407785.1 Histone deacetylase [Vigna angularis]KOM33181.1 hypothetical protein LR48_Vigan01g273700 [Vigna angularis]BAT76524.1 hypothetical protein VIGAN_01454300 [Vigna angularis var. angularis]